MILYISISFLVSLGLCGFYFKDGDNRRIKAIQGLIVETLDVKMKFAEQTFNSLGKQGLFELTKEDLKKDFLAELNKKYLE